MNARGQGAIEYLLLLAAAVVVVAVVISFMISTIGPTTSSGTTIYSDYLCKTLDTNTLPCGCYMCDSSRGGVSEFDNNFHMANATSCEGLYNKKNEPLLRWNGRC